MLNLTDRQFNELKWGTSSFITFLGMFPSLVTVDRTVAPPAVDLFGADEQEATAALAETTSTSATAATRSSQPGTESAPTGIWKIRSDLWSAVLDHSSNAVWVWDGAQAVALPTEADAAADPQTTLPTANEQILQEWRGQFEAAQVAERPQLKEALHRWRTDAGSSWSLPPEVRYQWFDALKLQVRDRLLAWFDANHIPVPEDFVHSHTSTPRRSRSARDPGTERLRALVIQCVETMTREELDELRLPPVTLLRIRHVR